MHPDTSALVQTIQALKDWLASEGVDFALMGGFAVGYRGLGRATDDIDAVATIPMERLEEFTAAGAKFGFEFRPGADLKLARHRKVLVLIYVPLGIKLDLSIGLLDFDKEAIAQAPTERFGDLEFKVVSTEHLLVQKAFAHRPKDTIDLHNILDRNPDADLNMVRRWLRELSDAIDDESPLADFEQELVKRERKRRRLLD